MAQIVVSKVAHFFMVVGGSKIHERMAHFFIDIYRYIVYQKNQDLREAKIHKQNCLVLVEWE